MTNPIPSQSPDEAPSPSAPDNGAALPPTALPAVPHPVVISAKRLIHRVRDIEDCGKSYVPAARHKLKEEVHALDAQAQQLGRDVEQHSKPTHGVFVKEIIAVRLRYERLLNSRQAATLARSLFLGLFSAFDALLGDLLRGLLQRRPELFGVLGGNVDVKDVLAAADLNQLKAKILDDEIESLRRNSYVEQFVRLETLFNIRLREFDSWPLFVEASQRRNLLTHCNGVVTEQYLEICRRERCEIPPEVIVGTVLEITDDYFERRCRVVMEVGVKLAHTLWRKLLPAELEEAANHLHEVTYEALQREEWAWAETAGEFAVGQKAAASEQNRLIATVNLAIARKYAGKHSAVDALLSARDWSATSSEFRLAIAVLTDQYDSAAAIMERIGERGDFLVETSYHTWPLFRDFRGSTQFLSTYEKIYGYPFVLELARRAGDAQAKALEATRRSELDDAANVAEGCSVNGDYSAVGGEPGAQEDGSGGSEKPG
jgi:hypothetical protein